MAFYLPQMPNVKTAKAMTWDFRGYNHNPRIQDGEFFDMQNLSSDWYPLLTPRGKRALARKLAKPNGLHAHDKLCWIDGTDVYYDGQIVGQVEDSPKQIVSMGAYILIWPDKVSYNTSTGEFESLSNAVTTEGEITAHLCMLDGAEYKDYAVSDTAPEEPKDGDMWMDTSTTPHVLKYWSDTYSMWSSVPTVYVKINAPGIGKGFAVYDGVTISGMENEALNGEFILHGAADDYVIVTAIIDSVATQQTPATIERKIPDMDFITEKNNRLWGCSSANHEVYACALGEPKVWRRFLGVSTDSYAVTIGSPGDFTGCITHLSYVLFFKEDMILKLYGDKPSNFQLMESAVRGVEKGSDKSLVISNEVLYYKARHDVCAYNTALPVTISEALGQGRYTDAVAGARGGKYYISMKDTAGNGVLFVYDSVRGMWHKEDSVYALAFATIGPELFFINSADNCLYSVGGTYGEYADEYAMEEKRVPFMAQTGDIGLETPDHKHISKLQLRIEAEEDSLIRVSVQYDGETERWDEVYRINPTKKTSFTAPIIPRRCDTMRIRLDGHGDFRLYSIAKTIGEGSEI